MKKKCHKCRKEGRAPAVLPLNRCATPGCAELVPPGSRFCAPHQEAAPSADRSEYHRANNYFYSSARWRGFRLWFLRRSPLCVGADCNQPATQVDHITPIFEGGARFSAENCQSLCTSCHSKKTRSAQLGFRRGSAAGEGGGKTYGVDRVLPHVKLKKCARRFLTMGVTDFASLSSKGAGSDQSDEKATVMTDGSGRPGGEGGECHG